MEALKEVLGLSELVLIPCGGGDVIASAREQWNDGSEHISNCARCSCYIRSQLCI